MSFWWILLYNLRQYDKEPFKGFGGTIVASCNVICESGLVLFETDDRMRQKKVDMLCFGRWDAFEVKNAENMMEISGCEGSSNLKMWTVFSVSISEK